MNTKYELTSNTIEYDGKTLYQIRALRDFNDVKAGDLGGWVESEKNLSDGGNAWVYENAMVFENALVYRNALVFGAARVFGDAQVCEDAKIESLEDICIFSGFGSANRITTAFRGSTGEIRISCGCFSGNIDEFLKKVNATHGDNKWGREYKAMIELIKIKFGVDEIGMKKAEQQK